MRIAIVSDVHSNLQALLEVAERIDGEAVDFTVCAGDIVGYGADPNRCCEIVSRSVRSSVVGNHDVAALSGDASGMNAYATAAAHWTARQISGDPRKYLLSLKESARPDAEGLTIGLHHGSLHSIWEYLYEADLSEDMLSESGTEVLVFGHTHVPYVKRYPGGLIINPGAVGQPRDRDPRASFAILETEPLTCRIIRVRYDVQGASDAILSAGLPGMLAERLHQGL